MSETENNNASVSIEPSSQHWILIRYPEGRNSTRLTEWQIDIPEDINVPPEEAQLAAPGSICRTVDEAHKWRMSNDGVWTEVGGGGTIVVTWLAVLDPTQVVLLLPDGSSVPCTGKMLYDACLAGPVIVMIAEGNGQYFTINYLECNDPQVKYQAFLLNIVLVAISDDDYVILDESAVIIPPDGGGGGVIDPGEGTIIK